MKVEYLNIFTKSISNIFTEMVYETPQMGKLAILNKYSFEFDGVAICFNITGNLNGQIVITADMDCILKIVGRMMDEEVSEMDELVRSAIGELGNMIVANATIGLGDLGYSCDITPPIMLAGRNTRTSCAPEIRTLVIPFQLSMGEMKVNVALEEAMDKESALVN